MGIDQIAIAVFGALAAWLSQARTFEARRWACIFGMLGQPAWFYAAWVAGQWGIFILCVIYCGAWMRGFWVYWIRPAPLSVPAYTGLGTIQIVPKK